MTMTDVGSSSMPVLILDNGAYSIKAGISGVDLDPRSVLHLDGMGCWFVSRQSGCHAGLAAAQNRHELLVGYFLRHVARARDVVHTETGRLTSRIFPNSIARSRTDKDRRVYVADEIEQCRDLSGLVYRRPFDRGMLVSWDAEKVVWDRVFGKEGLDVSR